jgi:hypothetical protein
MKYIKKLNIDFDQWNNLNNNEYYFNLFINDKNNKYVLYLSQNKYFSEFLPYIKENNIKLYWNNLKNILNDMKKFNYDIIVLYKLKEDNYLLTYSNLDYFNTYYKKMKLLKII